MKTVGYWYWAMWALAFAVPEIVGLASGNRFPTLSNAWHHARDIWPTWASLGLSAATMALGLWLLTIHWAWSNLDRRGAGDDVAIAGFGAVIGVFAWYANRRKTDKVLEDQ